MKKTEDEKIMLITELSSHSWIVDIESMSEHSDSVSEKFCLIIVRKKSKRVFPSVGLDQQHKHPLSWSLKPDNFCNNN